MKHIRLKFIYSLTQCLVKTQYCTANILITHHKSSHPEVFLGNCCCSNFIEFALRHGCSPVNLLHIFRTPFPRSTSGWLLRWWYNWGRNTVDIILILLLNFLTDKLFNRQNILIDKQFSHLGNTCYNFGTHWSKK